MLAEYLNSSYLGIDMYDADTRFLYGTTKLPLQELLRQGRSAISITKEAEMCSPDSTESRGSLRLIVGNQGHKEKIEETKDVERKHRTGGQPLQTHHH
jgi:rRNA pseudouridine-1189 N-methylase Emg1 (Nep1/Mra1 family)